MADTDIDAVRKQKKADVYTYSCYACHFYAYQLYFIKCDMYISDLRHIHDPVLSSLKMEGIRLLFYCILYCRCVVYVINARLFQFNASFYYF
jgi:hypothetical protein